MFIREITVDEYKEFAKENIYNNFRQSINYALFKCDHGYEYELIGYGDNDKLYAAAVILVKPINNKYLYAYVPHGFLIDYNDINLLENFTKDLINYYKKDDICFIKVCPPCKIAKINKDFSKTNLDDYNVINNLIKCGYKYLGNNLNFESQLPRFEGIVNIENFDDSSLTKNCRNKVNRCIRKGLSVEKSDVYNINEIKNFIGKRKENDVFYYNDYYNAFSRDDSIDYFLVSLDYNAYLNNSTKAFENEQRINTELNKKLIYNRSPRLLNKKMNSDKKLLAYKNDISIATKNLYNGNKYIAGALVVKHSDTVNIVLSGYNIEYKKLSPNYLLFYEIINYYKENYKYLTLNGMSGDFSKECDYYGLNKFKLEFNPDVYEYPGEFDLIINKYDYNYMLKKNLLAEEFNK